MESGICIIFMIPHIFIPAFKNPAEIEIYSFLSAMEEKDLSKLKIEKPSGRPLAGKGKRRFFWPAVISALAIFALVFFFFLRPAVEVRAATISLAYPSQALTLLNASGYVAAQRKAAVAAKTTGRLVWIGVEEGNRVKEGEVIARLENEDVRAASEQAEANLKVAQRQLDESKAELKDAELNFNRDKDLLQSGIISRTEFDAAESRYRKAQASVEASNARINAARAALKESRVSVEYTLIRAPFDAVVLTKNADVGDIITPLGAAANAKAAVVTIADMGSLQVEADVSESNIGKVRNGQPCEVQLDALPGERFKGEVHMIVPTADRTKASVLVKVRFIDRDPRILPEMSAKVAFLSRTLSPEEEKPGIAVDPSAIIKKDNGEYVYLIEDRKAKLAPVKPLRNIGGLIEVSGVKQGDKVVINPPDKLKPGAKVKISEK